MRKWTNDNIVKTLKILAAVALVLIPAATPDMAVARGGDKDNRSEYYGIVQERPEKSGLVGRWVIGDQVVIADSRTEFDQVDGTLSVGSCAKVKFRDGRVHEIDSEPMADCR